MQTTELDDLKTAWLNFSQRLEKQISTDLWRERRRRSIRSHLRPLAIGQAMQGICGGLFAALAAHFWIAHWGAIHLVICGVLLHLYGLAMMVCAIRSLVLIQQVRYDAAVLVIQKRLATLSSWRLRTAAGFAVAGCVMWVPLVLVIFRQNGVDLWLIKPQMIYWFASCACACLALCFAVIRLACRPDAGGLGRYFRESSIGLNLRRADAELAEITAFEREEIRQPVA